MSDSAYLRMLAQNAARTAPAPDGTCAQSGDPGAKETGRSRRIVVRASQAEFDMASSAAAALGVSVSAYIRMLIRRKRIRRVAVAIDSPKLDDLLHELKKQGANLNQCARWLNSGGAPEHWVAETLDAHKKALLCAQRLIDEVGDFVEREASDAR